MSKINSFRTFLITASAAFILSGCGNVLELARGVLYPFQSTNKSDVVPATAPAGWQSVSFKYKAEDGSPVTTEAWYSGAAGWGAPTIVYFHGNGENLESLRKYNFLNVATQLKVNFVAIDYPSYGRAVGDTNEYNFVTGGAKAIQWAAQAFGTEHLFVWGRSLGASVSLLSVVKNQIGLSGLILTSPWTSFYEVALDKTSLAKQIPADWLAKNAYNTKANAPTVRIPTLILHGMKDTTIPFKFGEELSRSFGPAARVKFVPVPNREHNDMFQDALVWQSVYNFTH